MPDALDRRSHQEIVDALLRIPAASRRLYPRAGTEGLEPNTLQVLIAVAEQRAVTVGALVDLLALSQGTVSTALAKLRERGLVDEVRDDRDSRRRFLSATSAGSDVAQAFIEGAKERWREAAARPRP
jgi:DNA-binding MarR family transcriptional regulator